MRADKNIAVIIPALNEEQAIGRVIANIPAWVDDIVVVDNGSSDRTGQRALAAGARLMVETRRGYGAACLRGIAALKQPDIVVFLDGDHSDNPQEMGRLVDPLIARQAELVIGSRILGRRQPRALSPQARYGNWLACRLMQLFWGAAYTDLGPFRAIASSSLKKLPMKDRGYGWTVEMQLHAIAQRIRWMEVPVSYRRRIGQSKVSGTLRGVLGAGSKILGLIFWFALKDTLTAGRR